MGKKYAKEPLSSPQFLKRGQNTIRTACFLNHSVWKLLKMSHLKFLNFGIFHQFLFYYNWIIWHFPSIFVLFFSDKHHKCLIWIFEFWYFPPIFVLLKVTCLVILSDRKLQVFKNSPNWPVWGIFKECWIRLFLWFSNTVCSSLRSRVNLSFVQVINWNLASGMNVTKRFSV